MEASGNIDSTNRRITSTTAGTRRITSTNRRTTGQHFTRRISAASLMEHRTSFQFLPAPGQEEGDGLWQTMWNWVG